MKHCSNCKWNEDIIFCRHPKPCRGDDRTSYESMVKAAEHESALKEKDAEIARLRKALEKIAEGISEHEYLVMMAREALEGKHDFSND